MKKLQLLSISVLFLLLSSCASTPKINPLSLLTGNSWELANLIGADLVQFSNGKPTLNFLEGGRLAGYAGCNNFSGGFLLEGANLQLDPGAMTKKACEGEGEDLFVRAIQKVNSFQVAKDKLTLLEGASEVMSFVPKKD